jgi:hypothetical protein
VCAASVVCLLKKRFLCLVINRAMKTYRGSGRVTKRVLNFESILLFKCQQRVAYNRRTLKMYITRARLS